MTDEQAPFRIAAVAGVTLTKWTRAWTERRAVAPLKVIRTSEIGQVVVLRDGSADVSIVRLPIDEDELSVIPLYAEAPVVVVPKGIPVEVLDLVTLSDLAGETQLTGAIEDVIALVAAHAGVVMMPHPVARLHARADVVARPVTDAPPTTIALVWVTANTTDLVDEFIGIVRGRTSRSSR